jgi:hypothetical protein
MFRLRSIAILLVASGTLLTGCYYNYMERPRPMKMRCQVPIDLYMNSAVNVFENNGYRIVDRDDTNFILMVQDSVDKVAWRYEALVRTWKVQRIADTLLVEVWSVSTRRDGSDVKQTWDKQYSDELVKEWMRPVMVSLESSCGLGSPIAP